MKSVYGEMRPLHSPCSLSVLYPCTMVLEHQNPSMGSHKRMPHSCVFSFLILILSNYLQVVQMEKKLQKRPRHHHNLRKCKKSLSNRIFMLGCGLRVWASSFWICYAGRDLKASLQDVRLRGIGYVADGGAKFTQKDGPLDPLIGADAFASCLLQPQ